MVPEYDPNLPEPPEAPAATPTNSTKRSWGPEQVTGPPDTPNAGDCTTAWASRDPDGGLEWLAVGFDRAVEIAEVRIRESYNPGAIVKVVALVNNQEVVLWEGSSARGQAPRDFAVRPAASVRKPSPPPSWGSAAAMCAAEALYALDLFSKKERTRCS